MFYKGQSGDTIPIPGGIVLSCLALRALWSPGLLTI
jgi:hypothetical protein